MSGSTHVVSTRPAVPSSLTPSIPCIDGIRMQVLAVLVWLIFHFPIRREKHFAESTISRRSELRRLMQFGTLSSIHSSLYHLALPFFFLPPNDLLSAFLAFLAFNFLQARNLSPLLYSLTTTFALSAALPMCQLLSRY